MEKFDLNSEYFLEISQKCRYNERMADWYRRMADEQFDSLYPLIEREEARRVSLHPEYRKMCTYSNRAYNIENCMRDGWTSDYYRLHGVKILRSVNRCKDRFCYNCQSMDSLQRFHEYAPVIDRFAAKYDIYHVVFSQPNVPGFILDKTLDLMYKSFSRLVGFMSGKKKIKGLDLKGMYGFEGCVRALEVSQNDEDSYFHPHFHCMWVMKKGIDTTPKHRNMFSRDRSHRREDRLFSDFEVFLQRIWYLLLNGIKVTKRNIEDLPQNGGKKSYPNGFSCFAEPAQGKYHEVFKYATKGSFSNGSILNDYDCFKTLYKALYHRRVYQTYGCFYGIDMNELHDDAFSPGDLADLCFKELLDKLNEAEKPEIVIESLLDILKIKVAEEEKGVKYFSNLSIRRAFAEVPEELRITLKEKVIAYVWERCV